MKQTTIQFDKRKTQRVTIQRLQQAVDSIANGTQLTEAIRSVWGFAKAGLKSTKV